MKTMMTIDEMRVRKQTLGYSYEQISARSGVPLSTVQKVFGGIVRSPRHKTLEALGKALEPEKDSPYEKVHIPSVSESGFYGYGRMDQQVVKEAEAVYGAKKPGQFTLEDYYALPPECRVELIDGVFYDMASPRVKHQIAASRIYNMTQNYIDEKKGKCLPLLGPVDVLLDQDDKTCVVPDFLVLCDPEKLFEKHIFGAPDWVVEVLSPSTSRKDSFLKLSKYESAGVKEYWLVDPKLRKVIVYDFAHQDGLPAIYGFDDAVPVMIYDGDLKIDFRVIRDDLERFQ